MARYLAALFRLNEGIYTVSENGKRIEIFDNVTFGRFARKKHDFFLDFRSIREYISRRHFQLRHHFGSWQIRDMNSTNGTVIRRDGGEVDVTTDWMSIQPGDVIAMGRVAEGTQGLFNVL